MPFASHSETVVASVQTIWQLLLDKIEDPAKYVPDVERSEILIRGNGFVVRRIKATGQDLTERITADEKDHKVEFVLVDHPVYEGNVENVIMTSLEGGYPTLTFTLDWKRRDGARDELNMQPAIRRSVKHTKKLAEAAQDG